MSNRSSPASGTPARAVSEDLRSRFTRLQVSMARLSRRVERLEKADMELAKKVEDKLTSVRLELQHLRYEIARLCSMLEERGTPK